VIPRYSLEPMAGLFSDEARLARWLEVELLAVEAWADLGVVPRDEAVQARQRAPRIDREFVAAVAAREAVTHHDVAAFVDVVQEAIGPPAGSWIHYGLTSSDVVDTALASLLCEAIDLLIAAAGELVGELVRTARRYRSVPMVGRTHGMFAEPITFGSKLALFALHADRDRERLRRARDGLSVGKLSGAVGTYGAVDPAVEASVCRALGLTPVPASQVLDRDRHAELLYACAAAGGGVERLATELRHLQRSEVGEVEEAFGAGQKGSSAMPHKRNPITAERLCGQARLLRGYLLAGMEDVALWHERDISHSSVERVALADACILTHYLLVTARRLVGGLVVHPERMAAHLEEARGLVFSQQALLALVARGLPRDRAYRTVQAAARRTVETGIHLAEVLAADPEAGLSEEELAEIFSLPRALRHVDRTLAALDRLDPPAGEDGPAVGPFSEETGGRTDEATADWAAKSKAERPEEWT